MEQIVKSGLLHFLRRNSVPCEKIYPYINGEIDLIAFDYVANECSCHFFQRSHAQMIKMEIQAKLLGYVEQLLSNETLSINFLEEPINKIVEEFGERGVLVLHLCDSFKINVNEYESTLPYLTKLNFPTTKLISKKYINQCIERVTEMITKYPIAWRKMGKIKWREFSIELLKMSKFTYFPIQFLEILAKEYDNKILEQAIEIYGEKFRLGLLDDIELRDALGLPFVPYGGRPDLLPRLEKALESPKEIIETTRKWNEEQLRQYVAGVRIACLCEPEVMNDTNLIGEFINDHPPGQIIRCCTTNGKIYQYTLSEARNMLKTMEDPYTRQLIDPLEFFSTLIQRGSGHIEGTIETIFETILKPSPLVT